jgi:hypothetical protein
MMGIPSKWKPSYNPYPKERKKERKRNKEGIN